MFRMIYLWAFQSLPWIAKLLLSEAMAFSYIPTVHSPTVIMWICKARVICYIKMCYGTLSWKYVWEKEKYYSAGRHHLLMRILCYFSRFCDICTIYQHCYIFNFSQVFCHFKHIFTHFFCYLGFFSLGTQNCKNFWSHRILILSYINSSAGISLFSFTCLPLCPLGMTQTVEVQPVFPILQSWDFLGPYQSHRIIISIITVYSNRLKCNRYKSSWLCQCLS